MLAVIIMSMNDIFKPTWDWIQEDYRAYPTRFVIEVLAWAISIGNSFVMMMTVPNPPLLTLYPIWIFGCCLYGWAAWTRQSFGMLANYTLLVTLDTIGLIRMIT